MDKLLINITLNLDKSNDILPIRKIAQGTNNVAIVVTVLANNITYTIPVTATARIYIKKPDGTIIYNDCSIDGNVITVSLTTQSTAAVGIAEVEIEIIDSTDSVIAKTLICKFEIKKSNVDASAVESSNEFTTLQTALQQVGDITNKLDKTGDSKDCTVTFAEAATEEDIASGETHSTIFGKILKSIKTLRIGKLDKTSVIANLSTTVTGSALDATQGKALQDEVDTINNSLSVSESILTLVNGSTISGYAPTAKKQGNIVNLDGLLIGSINVTLLTIPSGYRPNKLQVCICPSSNGSLSTDYAIVNINTDGSLNFSYAGGTNIMLSSITYIID